MKKHTYIRKGVRSLWWLIIMIILSCSFICLAQQTSQRVALVIGEMSSDGARLPDNLVVELYDVQRHVLVDRAFIFNGRFEFRNVEPGSYKLRIASMGDDPVYEEYTEIHGPSYPIQIRLPRRASAQPVGGVVSVNQLLESKQNARATEINKSTGPHVRLWSWLRRAMKFVVG